MPIEFYCKTCQKRLRCPDSAAGTKARCPQCSEINNVPLVSDPPPISPLTIDSSSSTRPAPSPQIAGGAYSAPLPPSAPPPNAPPPFTPSPYGAPASPPYPSSSPPAFPAPQPIAPVHEFSDAPQKDSANPYAAPMHGAMPPQPTDQSGMASSLGVVSIVIGSMSLVFGFCCCPIGAVGSVSSLGLGIWGWIVAANQLKQTKYAPYLRHLEPPARTALILCIIGTSISGIATLLVGGSLLFVFISSLLNSP